MKVDLYTKTILTIIAIALCVMLVKPIFVSESVRAYNGVLDVNIKQIDGKRANNVLDINIEKINSRTYIGSSVPVSIKK